MELEKYFTEEYYTDAMSNGFSNWWRRRGIKTKLQTEMDKVITKAMARSKHSKIDSAFERTDAYVWLLKADDDKSVSGEVARIEAAVRDALGRVDIASKVKVYTDPLRIEVKKFIPDAIKLTDYVKEIQRMGRDSFIFVPGVEQMVRSHKPYALKLSQPEVAHILAGGSTGSGKTNLAIAVITTLALCNSPEKLSMIIIDPKVVDIGNSDLCRLPHLAHPIITDPKLGVAAIYRLATELEQRKADITACIETGKRWEMPGRIFLYLDELGEVIEEDEEVIDALTWISEIGRGLGVHLCLATQRPTVDTVAGPLRANMPTRFGGWVRSAVESSIVTGLPGSGLEELQGAGMFVAYVRDQPVKLQAFWVDQDVHLPGLVDEVCKSYQGKTSFWKIKSLKPEQKAPETVMDAIEEHAEENPTTVFEEALKAARAGTKITKNELDRIRRRVENKSMGRPAAERMMAQINETLMKDKVHA